MHITLIIHSGLKLKQVFDEFLTSLQFHMVNLLNEYIQTDQLKTFKNSITFLNCILAGSFTLHPLKRKKKKRIPKQKIKL